MTRCPEPCGKVQFAAKHTAQLACIHAAMEDNPNLIWYWSRPCRYWHLTRKAGGRNKGQRRRWVRGFAPDQEAA